MLPAYKERRAAKHAAAAAVKAQQRQDELNQLPVNKVTMAQLAAREAADRIPRLSWLGAKMKPNSGDTRKSTSWHGEEWGKARLDDANRTFEQQIDKALIENLEAQPEDTELAERNLQGSAN